MSEPDRETESAARDVREYNTPNGIALGLGIVLMIPGATLPLVVLRVLGWHEQFREIGFLQNRWLFVGPLMLVMLTFAVSFIRSRKQAARYAAIILLQAAWYECAALAASLVLAAVTTDPGDPLTVAMLAIFAAPGFLAGIGALRRWGIIRPRRRHPGDGLDIETRVAIALPIVLLGLLLIDFVQASGFVPAPTDDLNGMFGMVLGPGFLAFIGARPVTRRDWTILVGTIAGIVVLSVAIWTLVTAALAPFVVGELTQAVVDILPLFVPMTLAFPMLHAARRLIGPGGPWPEIREGEDQESEGDAP